MPQPAPRRPLGLRGHTTLDALSDWSRAGLSSVTHAMVSEPTGHGAGPTTATPGASGYSLGAVLGSGGTAVVHQAYQHALDRAVAMKELHPAIESSSSRDLLLREARVTGLLEHPNIVPVHDLLVDADGHPRIVMQRIAGHTWTEMMEDEGLVAALAAGDPFEWHLRVLAQVCNAVHFAHSHGIVHRDLKPDNVMIGHFGEVYVMDWGLAVTTRTAATGPCAGLPRADQLGRFAGTPAYMAPEMLGDAPLSERTDVFLLGGLLYTILACRSPYDGPVDDAMFARIRAADPPLTGIPLAAPASPELLALIRRAMAPNPADRHATADEFRRAIERYLRHRVAEPLIASSAGQLHRLLLGLRLPIATDSERLTLYALHAQCVFGFEEALRIDPARTDARDGRRAADLAMAQFELDRADPDAADVILAAIEVPPPDLVQRVAALRTTQRAERERLDELVRSRDPNEGRRLRLALFASFALLWTVLPILGPTIEARTFGGPSYTLQISLDLFFFVTFVGALVLLRRYLHTTDFNRWLGGAVSLVLGAQVVLDLGSRAMGIPPQTGHTLHLFLWFVGSAFSAMVIDRRLAIASATYLLGFIGSILWPDALYPLITVSSGMILVIAVWAWGQPVYSGTSWRK